MALRLNPDTNQVERERTEYDVVDRTALETAVTAKEAELTQANDAVTQAQSLLDQASANVARLGGELEEAKSNLAEFDSVAPSNEEPVESTEVPADDGTPAVEAEPIPVQF